MTQSGLASIMPRTGSEYVFLSRTFHPAIGFMASFAASLLVAGCASPYAPQEFDFSEPVVLCWAQADGAQACII